MKTSEKWQIVEKKNKLACHGLFYHKDTAENFLKTVIPEYVKKGFFTDKTLKADDFEVVPNN